MKTYNSNIGPMHPCRRALQTGLFLLFLATQTGLKAQVINNGGTLVVAAGGHLRCGGDLTNTAGTITNNGRIEVQGSFTNTAAYGSPSGQDSLIFSGSGGAVLTAGNAALSFLIINKANAGDDVTLGSSVVINTKLDHLSGRLSTDYANHPGYVLSAPATAAFNLAAGQEIAGTVQRTGWADGAPVLFNAPQMQVATSGGTAPNAVRVTMLPQAWGGDPEGAEREVKRKFLLAQTDGSGFTADLRFPYACTELNNNAEANLVPWHLQGSEWNAVLSSVSRDAAGKWVAATGIPEAAFTQEWKLADPRYQFRAVAFLKGGWNNPAGLMRTTLNSGGLLPLTQPYNTAPYHYDGTEQVPAIPNTAIVDWVLVELRKPASGLGEDAVSSTLIGRKAGFLLNNGTVVDLDGISPLQFDIRKQGAGNFLVLRHRNHLAVMSQALASNENGSFANDFSAMAQVYARPGATSAPLSLLATSGVGSTRYGLWPGDVNGSGSVTPSDVTPINGAIAGLPADNTHTYNVRDVNLDRNVTAADVSVTNASVVAFASSSPARLAVEKKVVSHVPGEGKN